MSCPHAPRQLGAVDLTHRVADLLRALQILSTLLSFLGVDDMDPDSLDFGTIAAYTCDASVSSQQAAAQTQAVRQKLDAPSRSG